MMLIRKGTGENPRLIEKDKVPYLEFEALKKQDYDEFVMDILKK